MCVVKISQVLWLWVIKFKNLSNIKLKQIKVSTMSFLKQY